MRNCLALRPIDALPWPPRAVWRHMLAGTSEGKANLAATNLLRYQPLALKMRQHQIWAGGVRRAAIYPLSTGRCDERMRRYQGKARPAEELECVSPVGGSEVARPLWPYCWTHSVAMQAEAEDRSNFGKSGVTRFRRPSCETAAALLAILARGRRPAAATTLKRFWLSKMCRGLRKTSVSLATPSGVMRLRRARISTMVSFSGLRGS